MKKIFWLLLAIPFSVNALTEKDIKIECSNLKIGNNANCSFIINSENNINSITFDYNEDFLNLKTDYELKKNEKYLININSSKDAIKAFSFDFFVEHNDIDIIFNNLNINFDDDNNYNLPTFSKKLTIENIAFIDNILVNNQPIVEFNKNIYNYKVSLYEKNDYNEIKVITSGNNVLTGPNNKLYKFINGSIINFEVKNGYDTETYKVSLVYEKNSLKTNEIKIKEIPFDFNATKKYYYLETLKETSKITIENGLETKKYDLNIGENKIIFNNDGINYLFVINRLRQNKAINSSHSLKSLKIGDTFLNLQDNSYNYTFQTNKLELVEIETEEYQDYDIKYNEDDIVINLYDASANKKIYTINLTNNADTQIKKYSKTKAIIIFILLSIAFISLSFITIKVYRPFKRK